MMIPFTVNNTVIWYDISIMVQDGMIFTLALFLFIDSWDRINQLALLCLMAFTGGLTILNLYHIKDTYDEFTKWCNNQKIAMIVSLLLIGFAFVAGLFIFKKWCDE
jgi:hypothetical protein